MRLIRHEPARQSGHFSATGVTQPEVDFQNREIDAILTEVAVLTQADRVCPNALPAGSQAPGTRAGHSGIRGRALQDSRTLADIRTEVRPHVSCA
ncbi:hypothetical protein LMG29739_04947 [Paraburkholderia solisilvae]|uniref:Uncharacterized protein n=1 Tax=Paraburkholderia solisilvae TaxID=624376 RepID=A0A6J5EJZ9_9BURK|nr:hypothetical protein LMG29739_04947 [Paraburkholderia solisilvae]